MLVGKEGISSGSQLKRLIKAGAVENIETGEKIIENNFPINESIKFRVGKKTFMSIVVE